MLQTDFLVFQNESSGNLISLDQRIGTPAVRVDHRPAFNAMYLAATISDDLFALNQVDNMVQKGDFSTFPLPQEALRASQGVYALVDSTDTDLPDGFNVGFEAHLVGRSVSTSPNTFVECFEVSEQHGTCDDRV
jgi:hypothetical protein